MNLLNGGFRGEPRLHGLNQPALPSAIVGKHAVSLQHVTVLARACEVTLADQGIQRRFELRDRCLEALRLGRDIGRDELGHRDARGVQNDMPEG